MKKIMPFRGTLWLRALAIAIKVIWLAATVFVLVMSLALDDHSPGNDIHILFGFAMFILTCPGGLVIALPATYALEKALPAHSTFSNSQWGDATFWFFMVIGGYIQWFALAPFLARSSWRFIRNAYAARQTRHGG